MFPNLRKVYLKSTISDGTDTWTFYNLITDPWVMFVVSGAIVVSGILIVRYYDINAND
jgi:hypothetical protein